VAEWLAMKRMALLLIISLSTVAFGQATAQKKAKVKPKPKAVAATAPATEPLMSDAFSKAGLKTLFAIQSDSYKRDEYFDDLRVEMDTKARPKEAMMLSDLVTYSIFHHTVQLKIDSIRAETRGKCYTDGMNGEKPGFGCGNPSMVDDAASKTPEYKDLIAKEGRCVGSLEDAFRNKSPIQLPSDCQ
jgi:hypothetical protein